MLSSYLIENSVYIIKTNHTNMRRYLNQIFCFYQDFKKQIRIYQNLVKFQNTKFHENSSGGCRKVPVCNSNIMQLSLLHPLGTVSHRVTEGGLKQNNQNVLEYLKEKARLAHGLVEDEFENICSEVKDTETCVIIWCPLILLQAAADPECPDRRSVTPTFLHNFEVTNLKKKRLEELQLARPNTALKTH